MTLPSSNDSWRSFFEQEGPRLLLFARQQTRTEADARDVMQEAFLKIWKSREQRGPLNRAQMFTEIRRVAIDLARRTSRRTRREEQHQTLMDPNPSSPLGGSWFNCPLEQSERQKTLAAAVESLPKDQQEVLVLKIWGDLTFDEIGQLLNISSNTAASRYRYGLQSLKRHLKPSHLNP